jgi:putative SOS response-associated peptidase YedK
MCGRYRRTTAEEELARRYNIRSIEHKWLRTCTIITGEPNEIVREIHTRMPVILPEKYHDAWLSGEAGKEILVPFPGEHL